MQPRVDVIIAVHDDRRPIARAAGSILRGSEGDVRVIVVCHDLPRAAIEDALGSLASDERLRLIEHRDGVRSPSGPFNAGLDSSVAEWVSIVGSDDELEPGAIAHWSAVARRHDADLVLPRMVRVSRAGGHTVVATPPSRPGRRARLDGVRDRLAYRSAPLGLMRREFVGCLRFGEGLPQGEDVRFSSKLWFSDASIAIARGPSYLVHDDAEDRVTLQPRPIASTLAFVSDVISDDLLRSLPVAARRALGVKMLRVNVFGEFLNRPDESRWTLSERDDLDHVVRRICDFAPGALDVLPRADRAVLDALPSGSGVGAQRLLRLARTRRAFGTPRTLLPRDLSHVLDREAPLRFIAGSLAARR